MQYMHILWQDLSYKTTGEIRVVITFYVSEWVSALNNMKYLEENTENPIFTSSESLSLTHDDNNYSALIQRT